ncbi:hypothetical protein V1511DRAFT_509138 [Dipodascopsis uninucleata]
MSSTVSLSAGSPLAEALQTSIASRLVSDGFAEDETPFVSEFITVMMCNNKSALQIQEELGELLGPDRFTGDFTSWLFHELRRLESGDENIENSTAIDESQVTQNFNSVAAPESDMGMGMMMEDNNSVNDDMNAMGGGHHTGLRRNFRYPNNHAMHSINSTLQGSNTLHRTRGQFSIGKGGTNARGKTNGGMQFGQSGINKNNGNARHRSAGANSFAERMGFRNISNNNNGHNIHNNMNGVNNDSSAARYLTPTTRCRHWPYHFSNMPCKFEHPTEICRDYPNCSNSRGTCPRIHVGEDMSEDDAIKFVESGGQYNFTPLYPMGNQANKEAMLTRQQHEQQRQHYLQHQFHHFNNQQNHHQFAQHQFPQNQQYHQGQQHWNPANQNGIKSENRGLKPLCKFSLKCTNAECPFAHPTPANGNALILRADDCPDGTSCSDENCDRSHPSPASLRSNSNHATGNINDVVIAEAPAFEAVPKSAVILETCKFHPYCKNHGCKFRHPLSAILCRNGVGCTRADCIFTHPLSTICKFGTSCANPQCLYSHPNGKSNEKFSNKVWIAPSKAKQDDTDHMSERKFAVDDDENIEKLAVDNNAANEMVTSVSTSS